MSEELVGPGGVPCGSCPYRKDVPAGVWAEDEYDKLKTFDGEPFEQIVKGGLALFMCHQQDGHLCSGWVGCHNKMESMALRFHAAEITDETWTYESPIPLFASGTEAAEHGMSGVEDPDDRACALIDKLGRKLGK